MENFFKNKNKHNKTKFLNKTKHLRHIAVAFVDIRNFSELTRVLPPENLVYLLNEFYSMNNRVAKSTGGFVNKLLGDGALVLWGTHGEQSHKKSKGSMESMESKESRALEFFEILQENLRSFNHEHSQFLPELRVGVGMSSGETIVALLGDHIKMECVAVGTAVNLAARLENLCKVYSTSCVVSGEFLQGLTKVEQQRFDLHENTQILGHVTSIIGVLSS